MSRNSFSTRLYISLAIMCTGIIIGLILFAAENHLGYDKAYAEQLIRLHVIANSNTPQDQDLKLIVRDAVLGEAEHILAETADKQSAYSLLMDNQERLEARAQEVVASQGFDYSVQVKMGQFMFPYREYASLALPEGLYDAVRVELGAAKGDNWWCVLFPPLCLAELEGANQELVTIDHNSTSGNRLVFRFKLWEHVVETRYAQALQKWWQASAAGLPALSN